jgi:hypothetical protein
MGAAGAGSDAVGRAVWASADHARRLGGTVKPTREDDTVRRSPLGAGHAVLSAWIAGLGLWAIALFLLGAD